MKNTLRSTGFIRSAFFAAILFSLQSLPATADCTESWDDFETHRNVVYANTDGTLTQNSANPAPNYINNSTKCAKYVRSAIQYDGVVGNVYIGNGDYYRDGRKVFKMDVYSAFPGMEVKITVSNSQASFSAYPIGRHSEYSATTTKTNQWETLTFAWSANPDPSLPGETCDQAIIQFAPGVSAAKTLYFDNFASVYLITFDDFDYVTNNTYTYKDGTLNNAASNPSANLVNSTTTCARYIRNASVLNDIILASCTNIGYADNYKNGYFILKMSVYSPVSGTPVKLFLNQKSITATQAYPAGRHSYYTSTTTKTNEWEVLTFVYAGQPDGTVNPSTVDQIGIQFAPNTSTGTTFYFDELLAVSAKPAAASAISGPATGCKNQNGIAYSVTNVPGATYTWAVPAGASIASGAGTNAITVNYGASAASGVIAVKQSNAISCDADWKLLNIIIATGTPTASAGMAQSVCNTVTFIALNGSVGAGASGGTWSSPTGGTFTPNATTLKAFYTPTAADKTNGSVVLTLTTSGGCGGPVSSTVPLTLTACTGLQVSVPGKKYCAGNTLTVSYTSTATYNSGNVFLIQLSNATGSFSSFSNLGSLTSTASSGQIACTMPGSPTTSGKYRIRAVATNPSTAGTDNGFDIVVGYLPNATFYVSNYKNDILVGETAVLLNNTPNAASCSWSLGTGAVPVTPLSCTQSVSYQAEGVKVITTTAADTNGCQATSGPQQLKVYSCNPVIPSDAYSITGTVSGGVPSGASVWVKSGAIYTATTYGQIVYVSAGGSLILNSGGENPVVYLEAFASFDPGPTSSAVIAYDPNAGIANAGGGSRKLLPCSGLTLSPPVTTATQSSTNTDIELVIYPNPSSTGSFSIQSADATIEEVLVINSLGQTETHSGQQITTTMKGLLLVKISTDKGMVVKRINVIQ